MLRLEASDLVCVSCLVGSPRIVRLLHFLGKSFGLSTSDICTMVVDGAGRAWQPCGAAGTGRVGRSVSAPAPGTQGEEPTTDARPALAAAWCDVRLETDAFDVVLFRKTPQ